MLIELFWRGHSHWSMALAGGVCCVLLFGLWLRFGSLPHILLCLMGALVITAVEFLTGALVNVRLGLQVWDYSNKRGNLYGQVCPLYSVLWILLCAPAFMLIEFVYSLLRS